jgi:polysaccharide deacetylase 2 family uncharacterized protein YibQ
MARFSFPFVQLAAGVGAVAMVLTGQWLGRGDGAPAAAELEHSAPTGRPAPTDARRPASTIPDRPQTQRATVRETLAAAFPAADSEATPPRPRLAVIIDDVGHDHDAARRLMAMGWPVTLAVLPYAELAPQIAREAGAARYEVFVHLPMEPVGLENPGPGAITTGLEPSEISTRLEAALARVPGAAGLNNHMGSRATRDADTMAALFDAMGGRGLIFVDSLTHPDSLAADAARRARIAALGRDVFLDSPGADPVAQLDEALEIALETGAAIAIGHPYRATLDALETLPSRAAAAGVDLVFVSALAGGADQAGDPA